MDLSNKTELLELAKALRPISQRAAELRIDWLLIGAAARDIILGHMYGMRVSRATFDVDVAIQIQTWDQYSALSDALIAKDGAKLDANAKQRLHFPSSSQIDLVPFGGIEEHGEVQWPPKADPVLGVHGLREAYEQSVLVLLPEQLEIRIPTVEYFVCLKLFAWSDRHDRKPRHDSVDLADVLGNAEQLIELGDLYDYHEPAMKAGDYDSTRAVLQVLGERLNRTLHSRTSDRLKAILTREVNEDGRLELMRELGGEKEWMFLLRALLRGLGS
ncbi:MAG: putative nucleotidyltransferase [Planctomycetota bacterium]|jgi:predicted nucleotidyltransferase